MISIAIPGAPSAGTGASDRREFSRRLELAKTRGLDPAAVQLQQPRRRARNARLISRTGLSPLVVFQDTAGPMAER